MQFIHNRNLRLKPIPLLVHFAVYVFGHDWRVARGLPVTHAEAA